MDFVWKSYVEIVLVQCSVLDSMDCILLLRVGIAHQKPAVFVESLIFQLLFREGVQMHVSNGQIDNTLFKLVSYCNFCVFIPNSTISKQYWGFTKC